MAFLSSFKFHWCPVLNHPQPLVLPMFQRKPFDFTAKNIFHSTWTQQYRQQLLDTTLPSLLAHCHCYVGLATFSDHFELKIRHHAAQASCHAQARSLTLYMEQLVCLTCWIKHHHLRCNSSSLRNIWMFQVCFKYLKCPWCRIYCEM